MFGRDSLKVDSFLLGVEGTFVRQTWSLDETLIRAGTRSD